MLDYAARNKLGLPDEGEPILFDGDRKIIFTDLGSVFMADVDGKNRRRLVIGQAKKPVWAPNGRDVMFAVPDEGGEEIWQVEADSRRITRLNALSLVKYYRQKAKMLGNRAVSPDGRLAALIEDARTYI